MNEKLINYGGQALIEGVLMRGKNAYALAVRVPSGEVVIKNGKLTGIYKSKIFRLPFLRGLVLLWDSLGLGIKALTESANMQSKENEKIEGATLYATVTISVMAGIGIFFLIPAGMGWLTEVILKWDPWWGNLFEGIFRLVMLIGYVWVIGYIPDIKRVFAYHGAEHKTINAFEAGEELIPENVMKYSTTHARCGTAFLLTLMILSLFVFTIIGPLPLGWRLASRVVLIPLLVGVAYEYIKWTSRHLDNSIIRALINPNLRLQSLTTREPDLSMVEVSIAAFNFIRTEEEVGKKS